MKICDIVVSLLFLFLINTLDNTFVLCVFTFTSSVPSFLHVQTSSSVLLHTLNAILSGLLVFWSTGLLRPFAFPLGQRFVHLYKDLGRELWVAVLLGMVGMNDQAGL